MGTGFWHQRGESRNKVLGLEDHVGGAADPFLREDLVETFCQECARHLNEPRAAQQRA